jgi:hypothetical protein
MEKENIFAKMGLSMKESGKREENKVKLSKYLHLERLKSFFGCLIKKLSSQLEDKAI